MCGREVGTLYNQRQQFRMVNVYSDVRKNYKSAKLLMLSATKAYLCCTFMQWAGLEDLSGTPTNISLPKHTSSKEERKKFLMDTIGKFVEEFVLVECDIEKVWREQHEQKQQQQRLHPNQTLGTPSTSTSSTAFPQIQRGNNKYMST